MKIIFIQYLKNKAKKKSNLHDAKLNMAKQPQIAWQSKIARGGILTFFPFLPNMSYELTEFMDREKLKLIVKNLDLLVQSLKDELEVEDNLKCTYEEIVPYIRDYDEVFYDDE